MLCVICIGWYRLVYTFKLPFAQQLVVSELLDYKQHICLIRFFHANSNYRWALVWNDQHLAHSLYMTHSCGEIHERNVAGACVLNTVEYMLRLYGHIWFWTPCIRNTSCMSICGMSFSIIIFHEIISRPHIYSALSVTLYWVTKSLIHYCCLLKRPTMMALYRKDCRKCTSIWVC